MKIISFYSHSGVTGSPMADVASLLAGEGGGGAVSKLFFCHEDLVSKEKVV